MSSRSLSEVMAFKCNVLFLSHWRGQILQFWLQSFYIKIMIYVFSFKCLINDLWIKKIYNASFLHYATGTGLFFFPHAENHRNWRFWVATYTKPSIKFLWNLSITFITPLSSNIANMKKIEPREILVYVGTITLS
jgi:hypothetical protein